MSQKKEKKLKPLMCVVTSDKMQKSRVGELERLVKHPEYSKYIRRTTKVMFHDEENKTHIGDTVLIESCRPYSARKKFKLLKVVSSAAE